MEANQNCEFEVDSDNSLTRAIKREGNRRRAFKEPTALERIQAWLDWKKFMDPPRRENL